MIHQCPLLKKEKLFTAVFSANSPFSFIFPIVFQYILLTVYKLCIFIYFKTSSQFYSCNFLYANYRQQENFLEHYWHMITHANRWSHVGQKQAVPEYNYIFFRFHFFVISYRLSIFNLQCQNFLLSFGWWLIIFYVFLILIRYTCKSATIAN